MVNLRWLGPLLFVALPACAGDASHDGTGPVVLLSAEAQPIFDLMRWVGDAVPPTPEQAATLSGVDPVADPAAAEAAARALAGDVFESFHFDPLRGSLRIETIEREIMRGPDLTDEQALRDGVTQVVTAMGGVTDQLTLEIGGTTVVGGAQGEDPTTETLDKKVSIERRVLGLSPADYGAASFEMHGPLIKMFCTWRRFDYDASVLFVDGLASEDSVMAALAEMLVADGFEVEATTTGIDVGAYYRAMDPVDPTSDTWTLRLVGSAGVIDSRGGTVPGHEFYLDDGVSLAD